ncbi:hypothetical protein V1508DRAFT_451725 [Lipomyces doorenjongii]|uniref:uncharacterized protein n=1 Tax=Lipomyces doorenjongii TaxID=383834 RepID=UPI0034CEA5BE
MRRRVFLGMAIQIWSQLTGINIMMYYIVYILESAGIRNVLLASSAQYIINVAMTIPAILWVDKWGRRPSLLVGAVSMAFWLFLIGGLLKAYSEPNPIPNPPTTWIVVDHPAVSRAILAGSCITVGSFAISWGPVSWIYQAEVVPLHVRARSVALSTASNWAFNFVRFIHKFVNSCQRCQQPKVPRRLPFGTLQSLPVPERSWTSLSMHNGPYRYLMGTTPFSWWLID